MSTRRLVEAVEVTADGIHVVRLMRVFDAASVSEFEKVLAYLLDRGHHKIVVDLSDVEFVASAGWGAFTAELRRSRKNSGDIRLAGMNPDVLEVFFLLELDSFITAYDTVDDAIASFQTEGVSAEISAMPKEQTGVPADEDQGEVAISGAPQQESGGEAEDANWGQPELEGRPDAEEEAHDLPEAYEVSGLLHTHSGALPAPGRAGAKRRRKASRPGRDTPQPEVKFWSPASKQEPADEPPEMDATSAREEVSADTDEAPPDLAFETVEDLPAAAAVGTPLLGAGESDTGALAESGAEPSGLEDSLEAESEVETFSAAEPYDDEMSLAAQGDHDTEGSSAETSQAWPATTQPMEETSDTMLEEFELQDIHDPWILDDIDTLPEEDEMDEGDWLAPSPGPEPMNSLRTIAEQSGSLLQGERPGKSRPAKPVVPVATPQQPARARPLPAGGARPASPGLPGASRPGEAAVLARQAEAKPPGEVKAASPQSVPEPPKAAPSVPDVAATPAAPKPRPARAPQPVQKNAVMSRVRLEGDRLDIVRQIVSRHPHYGPTMIRKFLEVRLDPPVTVSRSTVYRWLRLAGLNTREQRLEFAGRVVTV